MSAEHPRGAELSQFMSHHILCNKDGMKNLSVMHAERMPDEFRDDSARSRPGLNRLARTGLLLLLDLAEEFLVHIRSFFKASGHYSLTPDESGKNPKFKPQILMFQTKKTRNGHVWNSGYSYFDIVSYFAFGILIFLYSFDRP